MPWFYMFILGALLYQNKVILNTIKKMVVGEIFTVLAYTAQLFSYLLLIRVLLLVIKLLYIPIISSGVFFKILFNICVLLNPV